MFAHNKRLQYTVRVTETNPGLANLLLEQFGGPQGELAAACRYFTQAIGEDDPGRKDMLMDIATDGAAEIYRAMNGPGNDSHVTQLLYGGGPALTNSGGQLWTGGYVDTIGDPTADLRSDIAAEARAKVIYERLINCTDDPGVKDALGFLMTREVSHQKSFEKALYSIMPNFPPAKMPGDPRFADVYFNMSQGDGDTRGPWNSDANFQYVTNREEQSAVDGGDGGASVGLNKEEAKASKALAARTASDPNVDPETGVELGSGEKEQRGK